MNTRLHTPLTNSRRVTTHLVMLLTLYWGIISQGIASPFPAQSYITIPPNGAATEHVKWIGIDSQRITNPMHFYPASQSEEEGSVALRHQELSLNALFSCIAAIFILLVLYSKLFNRSFLNQFWAFFNRSEMSAYLIADDDTLESEKIFPFLITWLFLSAFVFLPYLRHYAHSTLSVTVLIISGVSIFAILTLAATLFRTLFSYTLDFKEINTYFSKASFNTLFNLSVWGTLIMLIIVMFYPSTTLLTPKYGTWILLSLYTVRTLKSILISLNQEIRQIIYLFIYLCTFEIPLILAGFKLIKDSVLI